MKRLQSLPSRDKMCSPAPIPLMFAPLGRKVQYQTRSRPPHFFFMKEEKYFVKKKDISILIFDILVGYNFKGLILMGREKSETTNCLS